MQLSPAELSLPYPDWRPGQRELLTRIALSDAKYLLLEAPTGSGKSAVSASVGHLLGKASLWLTSTKALQDQYVDTIPEMVAAKGRDNYTCDIEPWHSALRAPCTEGVRCRYVRSPACAYYKAKISAGVSPRAVLNYQYWLAQANYNGDFTPVPLLVCDEAHLIEDELRKFIQIEVRVNLLSALSLSTPKVKTLEGWRDWANTTIPVLTKQIEMIRLPDLRKRASRLLEALFDIAYAVDEDTWTYSSDHRGKYTWKPVWVQPWTKGLLLDHAEKIIFMSATILDRASYCAGLGLPESETEFIRVPSSFPARRRPLFYTPVGKVRGANQDNWPRVVEEVDAVMGVQSGRGLIHTGNYKLARYIAGNSRFRSRLITHDTRSRAESVYRLRATPGSVLVSPSMTTGVDLPYELCDFQIICKLQFPDLTDEQVIKRKKAPGGRAWYTWQTACTLVQAYGRGMRAADDACKTYLLDGSFGGFFWQTCRDMLPSWFKEAIIWPKRGSDGPKVSIADQIKAARGEL
jgi:ATP-dependent DNA helicase DinG